MTHSRITHQIKIAFWLTCCVALTTFMLWDVNRAEQAGTSSGASTELVMGTDPGFKPFEYKDGSTTIGFDVDLSRAIATDQNKTLRIEEMSFDGLLLALQSGRVDMVAAGMTKTEDRAKNVDFSIPYYSAAQMIIVQKTSPIKTEADLAGKKIGVQIGTTGDILAHKITGATVIQFQQTASVMQELSTGRIDAAIMDNGPATQYLPNNPTLMILPQKLSSEEYAIAIRKGNTKLLEQVNQTIKAMKNDGRYDKLIEKYFGENKS